MKGVLYMELTYEIDIKGMKRTLPLCRVSDELYIGAFVIFGDVELTEHCAKELLKVAPEHDIMITAESKGIPLVYEMARQERAPHYLIARKAPKLYMKNVVSTEVHSITTAKKQELFIDSEDMELMNGKRVLDVYKRQPLTPICTRRSFSITTASVPLISMRMPF